MIILVDMEWNNLEKGHRIDYRIGIGLIVTHTQDRTDRQKDKKQNCEKKKNILIEGRKVRGECVQQTNTKKNEKRSE